MSKRFIEFCDNTDCRTRTGVLETAPFTIEVKEGRSVTTPTQPPEDGKKTKSGSDD